MGSNFPAYWRARATTASATAGAQHFMGVPLSARTASAKKGGAVAGLARVLGLRARPDALRGHQSGVNHHHRGLGLLTPDKGVKSAQEILW
jgi:hypothetical protein